MKVWKGFREESCGGRSSSDLPPCIPKFVECHSCEALLSTVSHWYQQICDMLRLLVLLLTNF